MRNISFLLSILILVFAYAIPSFAELPNFASNHAMGKQNAAEHKKVENNQISAKNDQQQDLNRDRDIDQVQDKDEEIPSQSPMGNVGREGKSHVGHMYLFQKQPENWDIVENGAWGKMRYTVEGPVFDFVFNGHELQPSTNYTLLYYPDPWPGTGIVCLGKSTATEDGDVHIMGSVELDGNLPRDYDDNAFTNSTTYEDGETGAKVWLVTSDDVNCGNDDVMENTMVAWNPDEYLFEYDLIQYVDTDSTNNDESFFQRYRNKTKENQKATLPAIIRSDLDIFVPEARILDRHANFKLEYWKNPNDKDGIYFKLDKESLTITEE